MDWEQLTEFREFWFPTPEERAYMDYIVWLATALSLPGLILMALRRERLRRQRPVADFHR